jgi:hypothetical protein
MPCDVDIKKQVHALLRENCIVCSEIVMPDITFLMPAPSPNPVGQDGVVGIATHYGLDGRGIEVFRACPEQRGGKVARA